MRKTCRSSFRRLHAAKPKNTSPRSSLNGAAIRTRLSPCRALWAVCWSGSETRCTVTSKPRLASGWRSGTRTTGRSWRLPCLLGARSGPKTAISLGAAWQPGRPTASRCSYERLGRGRAEPNRGREELRPRPLSARVRLRGLSEALHVDLDFASASVTESPWPCGPPIAMKTLWAAQRSGSATEPRAPASGY